MITREMLTERLELLEAEKVQMQANLNAYEGAIQDIKHWLEVLDAEDREPAHDAR